jgi:hypothetical protein
LRSDDVSENLSCPSTSATSSLWASCLRVFMMRTMAASIACWRSTRTWGGGAGMRVGGAEGSRARWRGRVWMRLCARACVGGWAVMTSGGGERSDCVVCNDFVTNGGQGRASDGGKGKGQAAGAAVPSGPACEGLGLPPPWKYQGSGPGRRRRGRRGRNRRGRCGRAPAVLCTHPYPIPHTHPYSTPAPGSSAPPPASP